MASSLELKLPALTWCSRETLLTGCVTVGVLCAFGLHQSLNSPPRPRPSPSRVSVVMRVAPQKLVTPATRVPVAPTVLLLPGKIFSPQKSTPTVPPKPELVSQESLPTISQPAIALEQVAQGPNGPVLPAIPSLGVPPAPPDDPFANSTFEDKPGGNIVVLGLLLNEDGTVIDSRILVPSRFILGDLTVLYASRGQHWKDLVPPIQPGEQRWIEQRIDHQIAATPSDFLP